MNTVMVEKPENVSDWLGQVIAILFSTALEGGMDMDRAKAMQHELIETMNAAPPDTLISLAGWLIGTTEYLIEHGDEYGIIRGAE